MSRGFPIPELTAIHRVTKQDPDGKKAQELDRLRELARQRVNARLRQQASAPHNHINEKELQDPS